MTSRAPNRAHMQGSATVEIALLAPVLILFVLFSVAAGRLVLARQEVDSAAADAARAASVANSVPLAIEAATSAATSDLSTHGVACSPLNAVVETGAFIPGGVVSVRVSCTASLAGLSLLAVPGSETLTASASSPIDRYRAVTP